MPALSTMARDSYSKKRIASGGGYKKGEEAARLKRLVEKLDI
jgi:hypothetical protein